MATLESTKGKIASVFKGTFKILTVIMKNKRGAAGIIILGIFAFVAIGEPWLTPYDPLSTRQKIACPLAVPSWFIYLPSNGNLSENVNPIRDSSFSTQASLQEWEFTVTSAYQNISLNYLNDQGSPLSGPGCLAVNIERSANTSNEQANSMISKQFSYPYLSPPLKWFGGIYVKVTGVQNVSTPWGANITYFIIRANGERDDVWSAKQGGSYLSGSWIKPMITGPTSNRYPPLIDSDILDPNRETFSISGSYTVGVEIVFSEEVLNSTVYIDDLNLQMYGEAFGLLGTDNFGRDIFSQLLSGTRISLLVGLAGALLSTVIGLFVGLISGYFGGWLDETLMRITDVFLVIPELPLLLILATMLGSELWIIILLISLLGWMGFARIVRSRILSLKERSFVEASRVLGGSELHVISKILIPNVMNFVYVTLAMAAPAAIYAEAYLSFLGLYDSTIMTWGLMLHDALQLPGGIRYWWWIVPPGLCIAAISIAFILIGHALDEIFNPKLRERY
jgi:peptide/nickel transport system permease protein